MHRNLKLIVAGILLAAGRAPAAPPGEQLAAVDERWRHYRSSNFELYSQVAEAESRDVLHNLELLRAVCLAQLKFVERARLEVTVYAFRRPEDFRAYLPEAAARSRFFRAFYLARPDRAVILLAPTDDDDGARRIVFHEYVHHVVRAAEEHPAPWYGEGIAELFAATRTAGDTVEIGRPHPARLAALQGEKLLPLETLFAVDQQSPIYRSNEHTGLFYAESWALLHYWYFGESQLPPGAVARFLRVAGSRHPPGAAELRAWFNECLGMDYPEMERRLGRYVVSGRYRFGRQPRPEIAPAAGYAMRAVGRPELRVRLAELALRTTRSPLAKLLLLDAVTAAPADPRPLEILGTEALLDREEPRARDYWEQALAAGTTNGAIDRELGLLESRAWFASFDLYFRLPAETAARLRRRLHRAIADAPEQTAAYEMLAWVEAFAEEPSSANVNLVQLHFPSLRDQPRTLLALAVVRMRVKQNAEALALLDQLDRLPADPRTTWPAEMVRAKLEGRPARRSAMPPRAAAPEPRPPFATPGIELPGKP